MKNIIDFSKSIGIPSKTAAEFELFCRAAQADKLHIHNGDTAKFMASKLNQSELKSLWLKFISEKKKILHG